MERRYNEDMIPSYNEEVIDVRKLLLPFIQCLPAALGGAFVGILLGFLISLASPKRYQATALLEVLPAPLQKVFEPLEGLQQQTGGGGVTPQMKFDKGLAKTYETTVASPRILAAARKKLKETNTEIPGIGFGATMIPNTQLLELRAISSDPQIASLAADLWADAVVEEFANQGAELYEQSRNFLSSQYNRTKQEIDAAQTKIKALRQELEEKEVLLDAKKPQLLETVRELAVIGPKIEDLQITLTVLKEEIKKHEKVRVSLKSTEVGLTQSIPTYSANVDTRGGEVKLVSYEMNPVYADLEKRISDGEISLATLVPRKKSLSESVGVLREEVDSLQKFVNTKTLAISQLERDLGISQKAYEMIYGKISETQLASSLRIASLRIISYSGASGAISHQRRFMLVGAVLGFLIGFLWIFLYPSKTSKLPSFLTLSKEARHPELTEVR